MTVQTPCVFDDRFEIRAVPGAGRPESGLSRRPESGAVKKAVSLLLREEWIEYTIPEKPNSRLQRYRLTLAGERALKERAGEDGQ